MRIASMAVSALLVLNGTNGRRGPTLRIHHGIITAAIITPIAIACSAARRRWGRARRTTRPAATGAHRAIAGRTQSDNPNDRAGRQGVDPRERVRPPHEPVHACEQQEREQHLGLEVRVRHRERRIHGSEQQCQQPGPRPEPTSEQVDQPSAEHAAESPARPSSTSGCRMVSPARLHDQTARNAGYPGSV